LLGSFSGIFKFSILGLPAWFTAYNGPPELDNQDTNNNNNELSCNMARLMVRALSKPAKRAIRAKNPAQASSLISFGRVAFTLTEILVVAAILAALQRFLFQLCRVL
jgi:hypothetical protein